MTNQEYKQNAADDPEGRADPNTLKKNLVVSPLFEGSADARGVGVIRRPRTLALVGIFLLAVTLTSSTVREVVLELPRGVVSQKVAYYLENADQYDTIFVGSSRVARHIDPALFDAEMELSGRTSRSFDLGFPGCAFLEVKYLLENEVLASKPKNLKRAIVELQVMAIEIAEKNRATNRVVYWHDFDSTWRSIHVAWARKKPLGSRLQAMYNHAEAFGYRVLSLGLGRQAIERVIDDAPYLPAVPDPRYFGPREDGYVPMVAELAGPHMTAARERFLTDPELFESMVAGHRQRFQCGVPCLPLSGVEREALLGLQEFLYQQGIQPLFFVSPGSYFELTRVGDAAVLRGLMDHAVSFGDPADYPGLYERDSRFDFTHLNPAGSELLTRYFATELASWDIW